MTFIVIPRSRSDPCCQAIVLFFTSRNGLLQVNGKCALTVINMRNNAKIPYMFHILFVSILLRNFPVSI
jgi:hypothetical protein